MSNRITKENIFRVISEGENEIIEFKSRIPDRFDNIDRVISAFANTQGGSIIFGYDEMNAALVGVEPKRIDYLQNKLSSKYKDHITVYTLEINHIVLVVIDVKKSRNLVYASGTAYTRYGTDIYTRIGDVRSKHLKDFIEEIQFHNRNPRDTKALELLKEVSTNPERILEPNTQLYRCRIISDKTQIENKKPFYGFNSKESFVPPANATRDMRANYRYIPYLYCANDPYTSLVEVRPRLGASVSIATIQVNEKLTLLDFTMKSVSKRMPDPKINLFSDLSMLFSKPVTSDDDILDYIPTQFVAEYAKSLGYDGIVFRSSLTPELDDQSLDRYNVVVFNYEKCTPVASNVVEVTRNFYECSQKDTDSTRLRIHASVLDMEF